MFSEFVVLRNADAKPDGEVAAAGIQITFKLIALIFALYLAYQCSTPKFGNAVVKYLIAFFFPYIFIVFHFLKKLC